MLKKYVLQIMTFFLVAVAAGQSNVSNSIYSNLIKDIGTEGVYVHYNTNLLFTGEYLHFKLYALSKKDQSLSKTSKIAYVELLDGEGERKIIQKVKLVEGMGQGDIFVPTNLDSGHYTFVAYTTYMKNWPSDTFFADDVVVLNPYTNDQKVFWESKGKDSLDDGLRNLNKEARKTLSKDLGLTLDKSQYGKREKVRLEVESKSNNYGIYSISVRKLSKELTYGDRISPVDYTKNYRLVDLDEASNDYLPDLRGEMVAGHLSSNSGLQTMNKKVVFSLPGNQYSFKMVTTDSEGKFRFSLHSENLDTESIFQVWGVDKDQYSVEVAPVPELNLSKRPSKRFVLNKGMKKLIEERSTHNQIENAYFNSKPDTVKLNNNFIPIYGNDFIEYNLDEYTRFPTFRETLVEIVDNAWIASNNEGEENIFVRDFEATNMDVGYNPLIIVDGILLQNHKDLIDYDIKKVETIRLARNQYVVGGQIFQGVFDVKTFDSDFAENYQKTYLNEISLLRPKPQKKYFKQNYGNKTFGTIPDFRQQLLWEPNLELGEPTTTLEFYTSDLEGEFEIVIEGFTARMQPVKAVTKFKVQ